MIHYPRPCRTCRVPKAAEGYYFKKSGASGSSLRSTECRECHGRTMRAVAEENRERDRAYKRAWEKRNRDKANAKNARLREPSRLAAKRGGMVWTSAEMSMLMRSDLTHAQLAAMLSRSTEAVKQKRMSIRKDPRAARLTDVDSAVARIGEPGTINLRMSRDSE